MMTNKSDLLPYGACSTVVHELTLPASLNFRECTQIDHQPFPQPNGKDTVGSGDADSTVDFAIANGLHLMWYEALSNPERNALRASVADRIRSRALADVHHNLLLAVRLGELVSAFRGAGIAFVSYKGPVLAQQLYGSLALRPYSDLDLMVRKGDLETIDSLMKEMGFAEVYLEKAIDGPHLHHRQYFRESERLMVEIHWAPAQTYWPIQMDMVAAIAKAETVMVAGQPTPSFRADDLLLILSLHAAKHYWRRLIWVEDIKRLVESRSDWDWPAVAEKAREAGCWRILLVNLALARDLAGLQLPDFWDRELRSETAAELIRRTIVHSVSNGGIDALDSRERNRLYFQMRERFHDRLPYFFFHLKTPNPQDRRVPPLPERYHFLYYLIRPFRLLARLILHPAKTYKLIGSLLTR